MFRRRFGLYELVGFLGSGSNGEVYRARDTRSGRRVALKVFFPALARDPDYVRRLRRDATVAARLHPSLVVPVHEVGLMRGRLFAAMRLVEGPDLGAVLAQDGPLAPARAVAVVDRV